MAKKEIDEKTRLTKELSKLIKKIDIDGILFLIQQANILVYNQETDKINNEISKQKISNRSKKNISKPEEDKLKIEIIPDSDKKNYVIDINSKRKFFTRDEFIQIAKISHNNPKNEAINYLFNWFDNERRDFLIDCSIREKNHPVISELIELIK
ncbi:MAG TPA: hypothetical protein PK771_00465, partial [Spirochaetota bacterium]|nr:hypothetical protein [Spirochaetota bacterium]